MFGAIIGDIVGSVYEFNNIKSKAFPFFKERCFYTDDTVMTIAVAQALLKAREQQRDFKEILVQEMQDFGKRYPGRGYGSGFASWLDSNDPKPYNSYGMLAYDDYYHSSHVSYQGVSTRQYKAYICFWAGKNGSGDTRYMWAYEA